MDPFAPPAASGPPGGVVKKRRRPALACEQCRRRKIKCDRNSPCNHCIKSNILTCSYVPTHTPASRSKARQQPTVPEPDNTSPTRAWQPSGPALTPDSRSASTGSPSEYISPGAGAFPTLASLTGPLEALDTGADNGRAAAVKKRITMLEKQMAEGISFRDDDSKVIMREEDDAPSQVKGIISKTRYFGPTHWMNGTEMFPLEMNVLIRSEMAKDEMSNCMHRCKRLARGIKARRVLPLSSRSLGKQLPRKELADQLVQLYLDTFEGVLRVLHVPSFKADYERYWADPSKVNDFFVILMQLCMALGATLYDDKFSLRKMAQQWVYEGQMWVMLPPEKSRLTIAGLQITCLLIQAKEVCAVGADLVWFMTGTLVRKAMYMGLHRDPKHLANMSVFRVEMRRRLWATILELNLQTAMDAGGSALLSPSNYDTEPPSNLDDEQLSDSPEATESTAFPRDGTTRTSLQIALLESFPLRSHILKHVNEFRASDSYEETLRLNSELTKLCRSLTARLSALLHRPGPRGDADSVGAEANAFATQQMKITTFHKDYAELLIYRCFHALHQPVMTRSLNHPRFFFSRKMAIDSALKILHICGITRQDRDMDPTSPDAVPEEPSVYRVTVNGAGMWRNLPAQSMFAVAVELLNQKEDTSFGMGYFHDNSTANSISTLKAAAAWTLDRIRSGETSVKGYAFVNARLAHLQGLEAAQEKPEIEKHIRETILAAVKKALEALQNLAVREGMTLEEVTAAEQDPAEARQTDPTGYHPEQGQHQQLAADGDGMGAFSGDFGMEWMVDFPWDEIELPRGFGDVGMMDMGLDGSWGSATAMPSLQPMT